MDSFIDALGSKIFFPGDRLGVSESLDKSDSILTCEHGNGVRDEV